MKGLIFDNNTNPCDINTEYQSVIIKGKISVVNDLDNKSSILNKIVEKYAPEYSKFALPENMVKGTGVLSIGNSEITEKYYS